MKQYSVYIIVFSVIFLGCSDPQSHNEKSKEHQHNEQAIGLELNNGDKWKVNDEMTIPIKNMERHIKDFAATDLKDYKTLADALQDDINLLTSSCTMTGKSHDELHKWLLPFMEMVNELSEAQNETEAIRSFENIEASIFTYNKFFQ